MSAPNPPTPLPLPLDRHSTQRTEAMSHEDAAALRAAWLETADSYRVDPDRI